MATKKKTSTKSTDKKKVISNVRYDIHIGNNIKELRFIPAKF